MGKRFLNVKTKEVFLGDNAGEKINEILSKYIPYQKVLIVTTSVFKEKNAEYYSDFLKNIKTPNIEYVFSKKVNVNKKQTARFLKAVTEDIACIVVLSGKELIELVKIVSFIKEIPYIIFPTVKVEPEYLCKTASMKVDGITKFYKVNAPLAVVVDKALLRAQKRIHTIDTFCAITNLSFLLLDEFLVGACRGQTLLKKHFFALKNIIINSLNLGEKLYNYTEDAVITLTSNALKTGLVLQSLNSTNIDAATLSAIALSKINQNKKMHLPYYKIISSLFLLGLYQSFILNLRANNYLTVDIKNRLKIGSQVFSGSALKVNLIHNLKEEENLKMCSYHIKEFEKEMLEKINETKRILLASYTIFKRMNLPLSYYIEENLNPENVKKAICLAPDLSTTDNFLKTICRFGVLDYNF